MTTRGYEIRTDILNKYQSIQSMLDFYVNDYIELFTKSLKTPEEYMNEAHYLLKEVYDKEYLVDIIKKYYIPDLLIKTGIGILKKVPEGLLRSSYEINFYDILKNNKVAFEVEKRYYDSIMKCDFYLIETDEYIEIAGMMGNSDYKEKMEFKRQNLDAIILEPKDFENFVKDKNWKY